MNERAASRRRWRVGELARAAGLTPHAAPLREPRVARALRAHGGAPARLGRLLALRRQRRPPRCVCPTDGSPVEHIMLVKLWALVHGLAILELAGALGGPRRAVRQWKDAATNPLTGLRTPPQRRRRRPATGEAEARPRKNGRPTASRGG